MNSSASTSNTLSSALSSVLPSIDFTSIDNIPIHDECTIWRVLLSRKEWNQEDYEARCRIDEPLKKLPQSKGNLPMNKQPKKGDVALFVFKEGNHNENIVMIGIIEEDGFLIGTDHQHHPNNCGLTRNHALPKEFIWVRIIQFVSIRGLPVKGQRTWVTLYK
jgi:hypothetical protein